MDVFSLMTSKTRKKILSHFMSNPQKPYFLRELGRILSISPANIRRELLKLTKLGLFKREKRGRLVFYTVNTASPLYGILPQPQKKLPKKSTVSSSLQLAWDWIRSEKSPAAQDDWYCATRDVFQARLQTFQSRLEKSLRDGSYLLTAVAGEIGNNSFDHNLGNWPDIPGVLFASFEKEKIIALADRGQGMLATIKRVRPKVKSFQKALTVAFTQVISARFPERRGNGLKFVARVIMEKGWQLRFFSGDASLRIGKTGTLTVNTRNEFIRGCFAIIKY